MPVRKKYCEETARRLLDECGALEPPVDVKAIAEALFLKVVRTGTGEHGGRALLDHGEIRVSANETVAGQRFSVGHEIGHYLLHPDGFVFSSQEDPESDLYASDPDKELEDEANYFSGVLLVPPAWLRRDVDAGLKPRELAQRYHVSQDVIFIALTQCGLLDRIARR